MEVLKKVACLVACAALVGILSAQGDDTAHPAGKIAWKFAPKGAWFGGLTYGQGVVYTLDRKGFVYALNAETGKELWRTTTQRKSLRHFGIELPLGDDPRGLCFCNDEGITLLNLKTGAELWHADVFHGLAGPACTADAALAGSGNGKIYAFSLHDGTELWQHDFLEDADESKLSGADARFGGVAARPGHASTDGTLAVVPVFDQGRAIAVDAATGKRAWVFQTNGWMYPRPTFGPRNVMLGSQDQHIYAVDKTTGKLAWKHKTGSSVSASARATERIAFVGSCDAHLYAIDQVVGHVLWRYETEHQKRTGGAIYSRPLLIGDNVYLAAMRGELYAVDRQTGELRWKMTPVKDSEPNSDLLTDGKRLFLSTRRDEINAKGQGAVVAVRLPQK